MWQMLSGGTEIVHTQRCNPSRSSDIEKLSEHIRDPSLALQATSDHNFGPTTLDTDSKHQQPHCPSQRRERFLTPEID